MKEITQIFLEGGSPTLMNVNSNWIDAQKTSQRKKQSPYVGAESPAPRPPTREALRFIKRSSLSS